MQKKYSKLVFSYQNKLYESSLPLQVSAEKKHSFYYKLQPILIKDYKKFVFQKILGTYPEVKIFLPLLPALHKREYSGLWKNLLPSHLLQEKKKYIQPFPINDRESRFAYYNYQKRTKTKLPLGCHLEPAVSYFLSKSMDAPQKQNIAFFFDKEALVIQKYFSDIQYFPNFQNLPSEDFLLAVENFSNIEIHIVYFFLTKQEAPKQAQVVQEKIFFTPNFYDVFPNRKIIVCREKSKKKLAPFFLFTGFLLSLCFSLFLVFQNFFVIKNAKKDIAELRKLQSSYEQIQQQQNLFVEGVKVFHQQSLQQLGDSLFLPSNVLSKLEELPLEKSWILHFQENKVMMLLQIASLQFDFWNQNKENWQKLLKKDILLQKQEQKDKIYYFSLKLIK